jgi:hypothetical protein
MRTRASVRPDGGSSDTISPSLSGPEREGQLRSARARNGDDLPRLRSGSAPRLGALPRRLRQRGERELVPLSRAVVPGQRRGRCRRAPHDQIEEQIVAPRGRALERRRRVGVVPFGELGGEAARRAPRLDQPLGRLERRRAVAAQATRDQTQIDHDVTCEAAAPRQPPA